ncbi:MAG: hypothetical protein LBT46_15545 [Planctomycetaceae bacterium]|jgi:hypothetical protein|nr:hypothetical protein [Planctomycetaceae bacterium]
MAKIEVEINGQLREVTKSQLIELARNGELLPESLIYADGKKSRAGKVQGLVLRNPVAPAAIPHIAVPVETGITVANVSSDNPFLQSAAASASFHKILSIAACAVWLLSFLVIFKAIDDPFDVLGYAVPLIIVGIIVFPVWIGYSFGFDGVRSILYIGGGFTAVMFTAVIIGSLIMSMSTGSKSSEPSISEMRIMAKNAVRDHLKFPDDASISNIGTEVKKASVDGNGNPIFMIHGTVKAPNALGIKLTQKYWVNIRFWNDTKKYEIISGMIGDQEWNDIP